MALQFRQPFEIKPAKTNEEAFIEPFGQAVGALPDSILAYQQLKDQRKQQRIDTGFKNVEQKLKLLGLGRDQSIVDPKTGGIQNIPGITGYKIDFDGDGVPDLIPEEGVPQTQGSNAPKILPKPAPDAGLTEAQKAVDKKFGADYAEFIAAGGYADVEKQLKQLDEVKNSLKTGEKKTGVFSGLKSELPQTESRATRDAVEEVVQRNLRMVLGPQFTEKEGNRLIARAYNPYQDNTENVKRLDRLIKQIDEAAKAKVRAGEYYEKNGTLVGYKGTTFTSAEDFLKDETGAKSQSGEIDVSAYPKEDQEAVQLLLGSNKVVNPATIKQIKAALKSRKQ